MMSADQPVKGQKAGGAMAMVIKILYLVLHVMMLVFWIVFLAGLARTQDFCSDVVRSGRDFGWRRRLLAGSSETCGMYLSQFWWACFFQLACIILAVLCSTTQRLRTVLLRTTISFFSIVIAVLIMLAYTPVYASWRLDQVNGNVSSKADQAVKSASAGCVALLIVDFLWLILATINDGAHPPAFPLGGKGSSGSAAAGQQVPPQGATVMQMMQTPDGKTVMVQSPQQQPGAFPQGAFNGQQLPPGIMYGPPPPGAVVVQAPYGMQADMPVQQHVQQ